MGDDLVLTLRNEAVEFITPVSAAVAMERAADEIERLRAEVAQLRSERDFLVEEYERAVGCGEQGYIHCASHLFNAITNARIDANIAERELAALREKIEKAPVYDVPKNAPSTKAQFAEAIASVRVLTELRGKRVRLVVEG